MKKSQLRNIIRESIKELINEQTQGTLVTLATCGHGNQTPGCNGHQSAGHCLPGNLSIGDILDIPSHVSSTCGSRWFVNSTGGPCTNFTNTNVNSVTPDPNPTNACYTPAFNAHPPWPCSTCPGACTQWTSAINSWNHSSNFPNGGQPQGDAIVGCLAIDPITGLPGNLPGGGVGGCMDSTAANYNSSALYDDGSCCYNYGCTDSNAQNYDPQADCDDGSCIAHVNGCMDSNAYNYNSNATQDDGSCDYGFRCGEDNIKPGLSLGKCVKGSANNIGNFGTLQDCKESGCEPKAADYELDTDIDNPGTPPINPVVTSKMDNPEDEEEKDIKKRMQELANIKK